MRSDLARHAPVAAADRDYIQNTAFDRNGGERPRPLLAAADWTLRTEPCDLTPPRHALRDARCCLRSRRARRGLRTTERKAGA